MNISAISPFIPSESSLLEANLGEQAFELNKLAAKLSGQLSQISTRKLIQHMAVINSYYSNLIEGNATHPHDIRAAQQGNYSKDPVKRDLQMESVAHIKTQEWILEQTPSYEMVFSVDFIKAVHRKFYEELPEHLWVISNADNTQSKTLQPGEWRDYTVKVGLHIPPEPEHLNVLMEGFCKEYQSNYFKGDKRLIAIMAAHHRFVWIHPFADGNGRVARLLTDSALKAAGLESYGVWCLSRGLARSSAHYKSLLAQADAPRQGDLDGRGQLSERALNNFCAYMLSSAIDQASYISELLELNKLKKRIHSYVQARNDFRVPGINATLKPNAELVLYSAFIHGELERGQALELCAMPERSASRLLSQLKDEGLLSETSRRSPLRWEIPEHAEPWYFPELAPTAR